METSVFESKDYQRARSAYRWACAFEYFVALLVADAFLAKLLTALGMSDAMIGIISSFITLAFLFQLFSIFVVQRIVNTKRFVILFHTASQFFFMSLYLIPFLPIAKELRHVLVVICLLAAYFGNYFVHSIFFKWANSYVDPRKRASFSAGKEMLSLLTGTIMTLILGAVMDAFEAANNLYGGFLFCAASILIFSASNLVCLILIKKDVKPAAETREIVPMREVFQNTLGTKRFRSVVILTILWDIARYTTIGFMGTYRLNELAFSVATVQLINLVGSAGRFFMTKPLGKLSDKYSFARGVEVGLLFAAVGFGAAIFTSPDSRFLIVAYTLFYYVSLAGTNANLFNITYSYVDSKYFVQASALKNSIGGIFGFGATLVSGKILSSIQANGNQIFGVTVYGQQILAAISFVLIVISILYTHFVIAKQRVLLQ